MSHTFKIQTASVKEDIKKAMDSLLAAGGSLDGNNFSIKTKIGSFSGSFKEDDGISITIAKKPMLVPMYSVEDYIRDLFKK